MENKILMKQNEVIISLLARNKNILGIEIIQSIVTKNKHDPKNYLKAYNSCNGENGVTDIAKIAGVKQPTITPILKKWCDEGILFNLGTVTKPLYKGLLKL